MKAPSASNAEIGPLLAPGGNTEPAWFLRESAWDDVVWKFAPTNVLEEEQPWRILWNFTMPSGRRFSDPPYASLREACKQLVAIMRTRTLALHAGAALRPSTTVGHFQHLRHLVRWMDQEGFHRFADLDAPAIERFRDAIVSRNNHLGVKISQSSVHDHLSILLYLYRFRNEIGDGLTVNPSQELTGRCRRAEKHSGLPYTPTEIAVPLVQRAIDLIENGALDILRAREIYASAIDAAQRRSRWETVYNAAAIKALRNVTMPTPVGPQKDLAARELSALLDMLYAACFIVISYLVGPRVSEILHLQVGCVQPRQLSESSATSDVAMMVGTIFKHEAEYYGRPHEWVIPPVAAHAVSVLEALSAPHRLRTRRKEIWVRSYGYSRSHGATEWRRSCPGPFQIPTSTCLVNLMNRFARWIGVPDYEGKPWHLTTHQGRKSFARFTALRDRSALFALAQHLGHRDRAATDSGYAGNDHALDREIHGEILEQSIGAWEHMLSAPTLGGRAGGEILTKRPHFSGVRMKADIKSYARMLVDAGLTLGVCDWGWCVYVAEYSACRGNAAGPKPVNREPSTCARCKNFAVSEQHKPYWVGQLNRCENLLNEPALPTQTLKIVRERLEEARAMLRSIESSGSQCHGHKAE